MFDAKRTRAALLAQTRNAPKDKNYWRDIINTPAPAELWARVVDQIREREARRWLIWKRTGQWV